MLAIVLSLAAAIAYGVGDFWGGLSSRRTHMVRVLPVILFTGTITIVALVPFLGATFAPEAMTSGALAGVFGTAGFFLVYYALALGPMGVASAIIAVLAAAIPYIFGLVRGDVITPLGVIGAAIAFVSILLVCKTTEDATHPVTQKTVIVSIFGGFAVSGFFLSLALAPESSGLAPILVTRCIQLSVFVVLFVLLRNRVAKGQPDLGMATGSGVFDALAAAAFIFATHTGQLAIVAVITNLYPAVTVLFAHYVIHERLERHQIFGLIGACLSVGLLTLA